jgi:hypothetical protein
METIIRYLVWRMGAEQLVRHIIENYMDNWHLSRNPKKRVSDAVRETIIS